jgi:hypothetical protein
LTDIATNPTTILNHTHPPTTYLLIRVEYDHAKVITILELNTKRAMLEMTLGRGQSHLPLAQDAKNVF